MTGHCQVAKSATKVTALTGGCVLGMVRELVARGMFVFPVDYPLLPVCAGAHRECSGDRGKHPACQWSRASTTRAAMVRAWFRRAPRNIGIDCGKSGLLVLDEDSPGELDRLCAEHGHELPDTLTVATGKGQHLYYRQPEGASFTNSPGAIRGYRIDVRGRGGYVVGPGSLHHTGRRYEVVADVPIAPLPEWVAELLTAKQALRSTESHFHRGTGNEYRENRASVIGLLRTVLEAPEGKRNSRLYWSACRMAERVRAGQFTAETAEAMLLDAAKEVGLGEAEALATITSAQLVVSHG
jgi:hypothetical protein